jgi:hypothetical protein
MVVAMTQESLQDDLRQQAESWIARFAPLVMSQAEPSPDAVRARLDLIEELRRSGGPIWMRLGSLRAPEEQEVSATFERAWAQLPSLEDEVRRALARVSPGHPESRVELDELRERLDLRAARQEAGLENEDLIEDILEAVVSPPQRAAGIAALVFGLGWNGFTLFHAIFMIGGMLQAVGPLALLLLLFYGLFFSVGFAMFHAAYVGLAETSITLQGRLLKRNRSLFGMNFSKIWELQPGSRAVLQPPNWKVSSQNKRYGEYAPPREEIALKGIGGRPIFIGAPPLDEDREALLNRINRYLAVHGVE